MTVKDIRKLSNLSQRSFCAKYNIPLSTLRQWEQGKREPPDYLVELLEFKVREDLRMRFADYDNKFCDEIGLMKYKEYFEKYIEQKKKELEEFLLRGNDRIEKIKEWENSKNYKILGRLFRGGKNKEIMLIIRYPDGTQKDERYAFPKISEAREKLKELREIYSGVDWSAFEEEI